MSKSRRKKRKSRQPAVSTGPKRSRAAWREGLKFGLAAFITLSLVGAALAAFKHNYDIEHDLSAIGKGKPAIVQIHNPTCSLCQQLRSNANAAMKGLDDELLFRIADVTTPTGHRLQRQHQVENVTLLFFDGKGELRTVLSGVRDKSELRRAFERHIRISTTTQSG